MNLKPNNLEVRCLSSHYDRYYVGWSQEAKDGTHRFHVWMNGEVLEDVIHHNFPQLPGEQFHKHRTMSVDSHNHVRLAIEALPKERFVEARREVKQQEEKEAAERRQDSLQRCIEHARSLGFKLVPIEGEAT